MEPEVGPRQSDFQARALGMLSGGSLEGEHLGKVTELSFVG